MSDVVIQVDNLSKRYRLGVVGTGTLAHDLNRWWHQVRGKPDPYAIVGQEVRTKRPKDQETKRPEDQESEDHKTTNSEGPVVRLRPCRASGPEGGQKSEIRDQRSDVRSHKSDPTSGSPASPLTSDLRPPTSVSPSSPPTSALRPPTSGSPASPLTSDLRPPTSVSPSSPLTSDLRPLTSDYIWALKDVTFQVRQGEILGIIGRNGAGKSTLLKILSRVTAPTSGAVNIKGRIASLLEVGTGFHPELTGRENIYLNGAILGMTKAEIRGKLDEIVDFSGVEQFIDTPVKRYSSGMYVRLAFAVAAHLEPEILIVDEVLAVGDVAFQKKCIGKMSDVAQEGRTILFVSHNMAAVGMLCQSLILLSDGKIGFMGNVSEGIERYLHNISRGSSVTFDNFKGYRRGPQEFASLVDMSVLDKTRQPCDTFAMGESMIVLLRVFIRRRVEAPRFGVMLRNPMDVLIHDFTSGFDGFFPDLDIGCHTFEIVVDQLRVYPGTYTLGPWIQRKVGIPSEDNIRSALEITVFDKKLVGHHEAKFDFISREGTETYVSCRWRELQVAPSDTTLTTNERQTPAESRRILT